jgi:hypothetical protein
MADKKITELNALTTPAAGDLLIIEDVSANETKYIDVEDLPLNTWIGKLNLKPDIVRSGGGLGFTKRMIEAGNFQEHSHVFEPFLSLELVPYAESREYGKKVLTNYVMYRAVFNGSLGKEPLSPTLHEMLKSLKPPFPRSSAQL